MDQTLKFKQLTQERRNMLVLMDHLNIFQHESNQTIDYIDIINHTPFSINITKKLLLALNLITIKDLFKPALYKNKISISNIKLSKLQKQVQQFLYNTDQKINILQKVVLLKTLTTHYQTSNYNIQKINSLTYQQLYYQFENYMQRTANQLKLMYQ